MNDQNLRPIKLSHEEATKNGRKGGLKKAENKQRREEIKNAILDCVYAETDAGGTVLEEMIGGMIKRVIKTGDPAAWEKLMEYANKSPKRKREDEELKIKREAVGKAEQRNDIEDLSILAELINGPDTDDRVE